MNLSSQLSLSNGLMPLLFSVLLLTGACTAEKKRVVFFGDSITQAGAELGGYIEVMKTLVDTSRYELLGAGISGNKVTDLQARIQTDVLDKNPDVVVVYIGINDD